MQETYEAPADGTPDMYEMPAQEPEKQVQQQVHDMYEIAGQEDAQAEETYEIPGQEDPQVEETYEIPGQEDPRVEETYEIPGQEDVQTEEAYEIPEPTPGRFDQSEVSSLFSSLTK